MQNQTSKHIVFPICVLLFKCIWIARAAPLSLHGAPHDVWLQSWIEQQLAAQTGRSAWERSCSESAGRCYVPKYIPARQAPSAAQQIPRRIWQTWSSNMVGRAQHKAMLSWIESNPTYEYFLFDDADAEAFICDCSGPSTALAYQLLVPGAAKADVWRVEILLKFGGVYVDSDTVCTHQLDSFIWPNASLVTGIGNNKDVHQWAMLYSRHHPVLALASEVISNSVIERYLSKKAMHVIDLTGPRALQRCVSAVLAGLSCPVNFMVPHGQLEAFNCEPPLGVLQIFGQDCLGGRIKFKGSNIDQEKGKHGHVRYDRLQGQHATLFRHNVSMSMGGDGIFRLGRCKMQPLLRYLMHTATPG